MASIFISYRRDDSQGFAGRLADDLAQRFGDERVFRDIEIPVGSDFTDVLHRAIAACDLLLVVIGRRWAGLGDGPDSAGSRLFEPTDWVRTEIEAAFAQGKQVVPVLVGDARMPAPDALPQSIRRLARLQAADLADRHWDIDVDGLAQRLEALCPALQSPPAPRGRAHESPAEVLRELGDRVVDELSSRRRPRIEPPRLPPTFTRRLSTAALRGLRRLLSGVLLVALVYAGLRLFGDDAVLRGLDAFEARLQVGWQRLQGYLERL